MNIFCGVDKAEDNGDVVKPESPNAVKFERFIFDALPLADRKAIEAMVDRFHADRVAG